MSKSVEQEKIASRAQSYGFSIQQWGEDDDGLYGSIGRFRVIEDDEARGLYEDDTGEVRLSIVGSADYGNQRVMFGWYPDHNDGEFGDEIYDLSVLDPID